MDYQKNKITIYSNLDEAAEAQAQYIGLVVVQMQVSHARLRYGMQVQALRFQAEKARNQRLHHVSFNFFGKALADDRGWNVPSPKAGNARHFLIFLYKRVGLTLD